MKKTSSLSSNQTNVTLRSVVLKAVAGNSHFMFDILPMEIGSETLKEFRAIVSTESFHSVVAFVKKVAMRIFDEFLDTLSNLLLGRNGKNFQGLGKNVNNNKQVLLAIKMKGEYGPAKSATTSSRGWVTRGVSVVETLGRALWDLPTAQLSQRER